MSLENRKTMGIIEKSESDHLVPKPDQNHTIMDLDLLNNQTQISKKKRKVNFNLTIDIKQETNSDDACVPQGPNSLSDFSDGESLSDQPIPTTPGGRPQVSYDFEITVIETPKRLL